VQGCDSHHHAARAPSGRVGRRRGTQSALFQRPLSEPAVQLSLQRAL